jgi:methionyl-tRNA formyltransferase
MISVPQDEEKATYSLWRDEEDYKINWNHNAADIKRFIDAVGFPYLCAFSKIKGRTIRVINAEIEQDVIIMNRDSGKILFFKGNEPIVVCGKGLLRITEAIYDDDKTSVLPLQKFRIKLS